MAKKQIQTYKFTPGAVPPSYGQYANAVNAIIANKTYIVNEAAGYLAFSAGTPSVAPTRYLNSSTILLSNLGFIKEEANAWINAQISNATVGTTWYGYSNTSVIAAKRKEEIGQIVTAWATDLAGGGNADTVRIARTYYRNGVAQFVNADQELAVYDFLKTLISAYVLTKTVYATQQNPIVASQVTTGPNPSQPGIVYFNGLDDIVTNIISNGLDAAPAIVYNYNPIFASYTYDANTVVRDITSTLESYLYDAVYGGNTSTSYTASRYYDYVYGTLKILRPEIEVLLYTFLRNLINNYILEDQFFASYQINTPQVISGLAIESTASAQITYLSGIITNTINSGLSAIPTAIIPNSQNNGLLPNTVALLDANKRFIQEETLAFIKYNVENDVPPFIYYTYPVEKCRRDISYIIEGYITDLKTGGNRQTLSNAKKYFENGVPQVDGDRQPEVIAHTFIRDLITNFVLTNILFNSIQQVVYQTVDNNIVAEKYSYTRIKELSNTVLDGILIGPDSLPQQVSNRGFVKFPGFYKLKDFLLITNTTRNIILYNFADTDAAGDLTYSGNFDDDFPGALYGNEKITTLTFNVDTTKMMVTDQIQIFVEAKYQVVKPNDSGTDAMERMRVGIPQSMLDADFEYGLQPTKWQAISLMRNYPSIYEIPGSDLPVINVTTDASTSNPGNAGASLLTVTTSSNHGLLVNSPFTIKALANSITGFSRAEGSFLVATVPSNTSFTYYAKSKVGTANGQSLSTIYTQARKAGYYTGSSISSPIFNVYSSGSNGSITTSLITAAGRDTIGFIGAPPPIGSPITGSAINLGTQITAVTGSGGIAATTTLAVTALNGAVTLTVNDTTGISAGLVFDRGDGVGINITDVSGNVVSLGNALTSKINGTSETYINLNQTSTTGDGIGAVFTVSRNNDVYTATATTPGSLYDISDIITIAGTNLSGTSPTNNVTLTVLTATGKNTVVSLDNGTLVPGAGYTTATYTTGVNSGLGTGLTLDVVDNGSGGVASVTINAPGKNYSVGNIISINNGSAGGVLTFNNATLSGGAGQTSGAGRATTGGSGTGLTLNITASGSGIITSVSVANPGSGYTAGNVISIPAGNVGAVISLDGASLTGGTGWDATTEVSTTGGTGTGLKVNVITNANYQITALTINNAGSGYAIGNTITITPPIVGKVFTLNNASLAFGRGHTTRTGVATTGGSGSGLIVNVTASAFGQVLSVAIASPGSGYTANDTISIPATVSGAVQALPLAGAVLGLNNSTLSGGTGQTTRANVSVTGGSGTGLIVSVTDNGSGVLSSVFVTNGGSGYTVGNTITIPPPVAGAVTGISAIVSPGSGYTDLVGVATTGGTGTGLTVNTVTSAGGITSCIINNIGSGYTVGNTITISGGSGTATFTITSIATSATINVFSVQSNPVTAAGTGYSNATGVATTGGTGTGLTVNTTTTLGGVTVVVVNNPGSGYSVNDTIIITGGSGTATFTVVTTSLPASINVDVVSSIATFNVLSVAATATITVASVSAISTIEVASINAGGVIQSLAAGGTPITAPSKDFISAFTLSDVTTAQIASGDTSLTYSAIPTIEVSFPSAHGLVPGDSVTVQISSSGTGAQLAAGAYYVEQTPTNNTLRYTARSVGTISNTLTGFLYARPDSYFVHRPFDGGVQLGTGGPSHGATAIRMSKKYIRYQSGKGVMYNTGALFAPSYDIRSITAASVGIGSVITLTTDDVDHGCQVGARISISGVSTLGYNGVYSVIDILDERRLSIIAYQQLGATTAELESPCQMSIRNWHGSTVRSGIFDDQNGMFWQYDGIRMAVVRRSSTFQIAGTIAVNKDSNLIVGSNTRFTQQLAQGDRIVIRGMSHVVSQVDSDTSMTVTPDFRGVSNIDNVKICKTVDLIVPQENWNLDTCDGSGPSGYSLDVSKMQMIGIQHTWYGAGFIDFMLRGPEGNYIWVHRFRNSNVNTEAYMRTGNQPVRYEVINEGARDKLSANIGSTQTTIPLTNTFFFPNSGTVLIKSELVRFTGNSGTALTGCTRNANLTQFTGGAQRAFSGSSATSHDRNTGVVLISNTITPIISHWGSAFMIDGQFDSDRGYIFNYAATGVSVSVDKATAFLIRLAPSVSNAQIGDLGEKELLNRAQLLLSEIGIASDPVSSVDPFIGNIWSNGGTATSGSYYSYVSLGIKNWYQATSSGTFSSTPPTFTSGTGASATHGVNLSFAGATPQNDGAIIVEGVLNPINYPSDPTLITWTGLNSQAAGGQPSFSQIASGGSVTWGGGASTTTALINGAFTTRIAANSFSASTSTVTATSFSTVAQIATAVSIGSLVQSITALGFNDGSPYGNVAQNITALSFNSPGPFGNNTYLNAINSSRNDFLITNAQYDSLTTVPLPGDYVTGTGMPVGVTITAITRAFGGTLYTRIILSANMNTNTATGAGSNVGLSTITSPRYSSAVSNLRLTNDITITNTQYDALTLQPQTGNAITGTGINANTTIASVTRGYLGTIYTRIVLSQAMTLKSTAGSGNNVALSITTAYNTTYTSAISTARSDFLIAQTTLNSLNASTPLAAGDTVSAPTYITSNQTISAITPNFITIASINYARIQLSAVPNSTSPVAATTGSQNITVTFTSALAARYNTAISNARTDFLITQASLATASINVTDVLSAASVVTSNQTVSSVTANYTTISGVSYARIIMSSQGNLSSTAGTGNNVSITVTSAATALYAWALSVARNDFLITDASYNGSGIAIGDGLSLATYLVGSQTITAITPSYITIGSTSYTRIVMSSPANASSPGGAGNNQNVTVTALGSGSTYLRSSTLFFNSATWEASGAVLGTKLASDQISFPAGTSVAVISSRTFGTVISTVSGGSGNGTSLTLTLVGTQLYAIGSLVTVTGIVGGSGDWIGTFTVTGSTAGSLIVTATGTGTPTFTGGRVVGATAYRITFTQSANTSISASTSLKFQFGANYALPGEQVFSFISNPGASDRLNLAELKELTATAIGGRGSFPNGPDVLAINIYKVSGSATPVNVILRWGEAQA